MNKEIFSYIDSKPSIVHEKGSLNGKSISIQPNMSVSGWPTEAGSKALDRFVALEDATVVENLRTAGATIKGSTHMSELGFGLIGDTAVQAVATGEVDAALMTDSMGEARIAASSKNLFGFKPSFGIVSRYGLIGLIPSMECYGIVANTPLDIAILMAAIAGTDDHDYSMPDDVLPDFGRFEDVTALGTCGVISECFDVLEPAHSKAFSAAISRLAETGMEIREVSLQDFDLFRVAHNVIGSVEASSSCGKYDSVRYGHRTQSARNWNEMYIKSRAESFGLLVKTYLFQGAYFQFENYETFENACRVRAQLVRDMEALYETIDVLIMPTRKRNGPLDETHSIDDVYDVFDLTLPANITGQPAIHIPGSLFGRETDPGIQFMAPRLGDMRLLSIANHLMNVREGDM
jgi:aspartyl-tRNA(Asn)/glutamyl-tRNA(Gln) amidotransferase subunit A